MKDLSKCDNKCSGSLLDNLVRDSVSESFIRIFENFEEIKYKILNSFRPPLWDEW